MSPAPAGADETRRLAGEVACVLDECRTSLAVHPRKLRELAALCSSSAPGGRFIPAFCTTLSPLSEILRRSPASDRFAAAFASAFAAGDGGSGFLEGFLRFLLAAFAAAHRPARFRSCQIISEIIMQLADYAEVSDEIWDEVIDAMKVWVQDKNPAIRVFA